MERLPQQNIALVVIGRNESEHLAECLAGPIRQSLLIVYVDSGSTDNSVEIARGAGVEVVELDSSQPYTAARGRNAGFVWLKENHPEIEFVQFIDGDCVLRDDWLTSAVNFLCKETEVAAVCGRVRERYPSRSIYNRLCDAEFARSEGEAPHCGGIFMVRAKAFQSVGGFNASLVAGEEPELCFRLRQQGWRLWRLANEMALHDANLLRFGQWWQRTVRSGHAYATGMALHGGKPEYFCVKQCLSIGFWGVVLPLTVAALVWPTHGWSLLLLMLYIKPLLSGVRTQWKAGQSLVDSAEYATFCLLAKVPQALGVGKGLCERRDEDSTASNDPDHGEGQAYAPQSRMNFRIWGS